MCRFALYLGRPIAVSTLVTEPDNSIIHQSFHSHEREEPLNGDGFGLAWYADRFDEPAVFKEVSPAWSNMNLLHLARVVSSSCVLAHVRAATPGLPVTQLNCHPFVRGRYAFMHNGHIGGFLSLKRQLRRQLSDTAYHDVAGSTDSEHLLALVQDHLAAGDGDTPLETMTEALVGAMRQAERLRAETGAGEASLLNLALTDGRRAVVSRYSSYGDGRSNTLYVRTGDRFVCEQGACRMLPSDGANRAVLIASEPLSRGEGWEPVPLNHLVLVDDDLRVELREIGI